MIAPSFASLRVRLMLLVVLGLLPLLALAIYSADRQRKAGADRAKVEALRLARLCANFDERRVDSARQLLVTLAQLPAVRSRDARGCNLVFARILREYPAYIDIRAGDPDGDIFARGASGGTVDKGGERSFMQQAFERKDISIKPYQMDNQGTRATMSIAYPATDENGKPLAVVCVVLDLSWLAKFAVEAQLPPESVFAVSNMDGIVLARYPQGYGWVGKSVTKSAVGQIEQDAISKGIGELTAEAAGFDGVRRLYAFTRAHFGDDGYKESRVYFHVGIPIAAAYLEAKRNLTRQALLLSGLAVLAIASTWFFARPLILRPVKSLVATTKQFAAGDLSARTSLTIRGGELEQLASAFDEMAASLESRTAERKVAEDALRKARDELEVRVAQRTAELAASNEGLQKEIAERKKIQEELHLSKERLELVIHGTNDGIWDWDIKGNEVYFSPRWKSMLGWEDHEIANRFEEWEKRIHPEDHDRALETVRAYLDGKTGVYELEHRLLHKDGTYRWILSRGAALRDADGKPYRMVGSHIDLTERKQTAENLKRAAEELHLSKERLELVFQGTNDGIWDWDVKSNEVYFSPRWKSLLGWEDHEIANRFEEWERRLHPEDHDRAMETVRAYLNGETQTYELEHRLLHKDGTYRWMLARATSLRDEQGKPYRMVGSILDLTERKKAAEDLKKAADELARSNKELEQFAYIASHDLQEPLRMVSSYTELLARRYKEKLDPTAMEFIGYAVDGARRMSILINDLLAYSRVNTQRKPTELVDCAEIFRMTLDNLKVVIQEAKAIVTADALPSVIGDPTQLLQLFQNLIGNAIKFHGKEAPRVQVSASRRAGVWLFSVKDNGIGIAQEDFERIFLIFQRLHGREEYPGTGIGLAVCKRIVERHGGRLWLESKPGEGTTFFFTIPGRNAENA